MTVIKETKMDLPENVRTVLQTIESGGFEAYVVGGCVRNTLIGKQPEDYDITSSARPEDIKRLFKKTFDTGIKHGTVTVVLNKAAIEVTSFRIDGDYLDNRRPESVSFTTRLDMDLQRRDFTMNAIAYGAKTGFIDLYGGMTDIRNRTIRGVGDPDRRYGEDALRMLRAIRFAGQLGFEIERETYEAISRNASLIRNISAERIRDELVKLIISDFPEGLEMIYATGLSANIYPLLDEYLKKYLSMALPAVKLCAQIPRLRLALLLQYMPVGQIKDLLSFLKSDGKLMKEVMLYAGSLNEEISDDSVQIRKMLSRLGRDAFEDLLYLKSVRAEAEAGDIGLYRRVSAAYKRIIDAGDCTSMSRLRINGDVLLKLGFTGGRELGEALRQLLDMVLREPEKNNEEILQSEALKLLSRGKL